MKLKMSSLDNIATTLQSEAVNIYDSHIRDLLEI